MPDSTTEYMDICPFTMGVDGQNDFFRPEVPPGDTSDKCFVQSTEYTYGLHRFQLNETFFVIIDSFRCEFEGNPVFDGALVLFYGEPQTPPPGD
mgnify:CR=1 FL=1